MSRRVCLPGAAVACVVALASLVPSGAAAWAAGDATSPTVLRVGVAADILLDISRKDAQVAFNVWAKELTKEGGEAADTQSVFLEDQAAMAIALQQSTVDLVLLPTLDFLQLTRRAMPIEPVRVGIAARTSLDAELLLTHRDSLPHGLRNLAGKRLMTQPGAVGSLSRLWLDTVLAKQGFQESKYFFGEVRQGMRATQVILPVFFRQAEAAVVKEASFVTVNEINPQVRRDVVVLARSPDLVHGVVCFNKQIAPEPRRLMMNGLQRMTTSAAGRQILSLFRINQLPPFEPSQLDGVLGLVREQAALLERKGG